MDLLEDMGGKKMFRPTEIKILEYLCKGYSTKQVAFELGNTNGTIKTYLSSMYKREGLKNGCHAVAVYMEYKFIKQYLKEVA